MFATTALEGHTILVTGASSGIGRETAVLLGRLGAHVVLVGRNSKRLNETMTQMPGVGHRAEIFDLMIVEEISAWMENLSAEVGSFSGLVHCAGTQLIRPIRATSSNDLETLMRINVTAAYCLAKSIRKKEIFKLPCSIVFLSSVMGLVGQSAQTAYSTSKGAVISLVKSLAIEFARDGIRVNCVAPAMVRTEMFENMMKTLSKEHQTAIEERHPLGFGRPDDVAYAIAYLLSDMSRWVTGTTIVVDGGYTAH